MSAGDTWGAGLLDRRYRLLAVVGQGRVGRVYKAVHVGLDATVALKELRYRADSPGASGEVARDGFFREARLLTSLSHPNLARVHDYFSHGRACFLVMDLVEGETLASRLASLGRLSEREVISIGLQLCDVLAYLHGQVPPFAVGDLDADAVRIGRDGRAVLVGLGVGLRFASRVRNDGHGRDTPPEEEALASSRGVRADLYGLAALLHRLLTGEESQVSTGIIMSPHETDPTSFSTVDAVIARGMGQGAGGFASAEEMGQALRLAAQALVPPRAPAGEFQRGRGMEPSLSGSSRQDVDHAYRHRASIASLGEDEPSWGATASPVTPSRETRRDTPDGAAHWHRRATATHPLPGRRDPSRSRERRLQQALLGLAAAGLMLASTFAFMLALSVASSRNAGGAPTDSRSSAILHGMHVTPMPVVNHAGSRLAGPPPNANPPLRQSIGSAPPTPAAPSSGPPTAPATSAPTQVPTATAMPSPTVAPTETPEATVTPTETVDPSPAPELTPTPAFTPTPQVTPVPTPTPSTVPTGTPPAQGAVAHHRQPRVVTHRRRRGSLLRAVLL
jgi:hypothetical protein